MAVSLPIPLFRLITMRLDTLDNQWFSIVTIEGNQVFGKGFAVIPI